MRRPRRGWLLTDACWCGIVRRLSISRHFFSVSSKRTRAALDFFRGSHGPRLSIGSAPALAFLSSRVDTPSSLPAPSTLVKPAGQGARNRPSDPGRSVRPQKKKIHPRGGDVGVKCATIRHCPWPWRLLVTPVAPNSPMVTHFRVFGDAVVVHDPDAGLNPSRH